MPFSKKYSKKYSKKKWTSKSSHKRTAKHKPRKYGVKKTSFRKPMSAKRVFKERRASIVKKRRGVVTAPLMPQLSMEELSHVGEPAAVAASRGAAAISGPRSVAWAKGTQPFSQRLFHKMTWTTGYNGGYQTGAGTDPDAMVLMANSIFQPCVWYPAASGSFPLLAAIGGEPYYAIMGQIYSRFVVNEATVYVKATSRMSESLTTGPYQLVIFPSLYGPSTGLSVPPSQAIPSDYTSARCVPNIVDKPFSFDKGVNLKHTLSEKALTMQDPNGDHAEYAGTYTNTFYNTTSARPPTGPYWYIMVYDMNPNRGGQFLNQGDVVQIEVKIVFKVMSYGVVTDASTISFNRVPDVHVDEDDELEAGFTDMALEPKVVYPKVGSPASGASGATRVEAAPRAHSVTSTHLGPRAPRSPKV